jgi:macrolide-specific efflux system membrane fusion protein
MTMNRSCSTLVWIMAFVFGAQVSTATGEIVVESALLQLVEQVNVPARTPGVLATVDVSKGALVDVGTPLAQIDDRQAQMQNRRAAIELKLSHEKSNNDVAIRAARKSLEFARAELDRFQRAAAGLAGSISQSQIEESRFKVGKAGFELEAANHEARLNKLTEQLKQQELELCQYEIEIRRITAPVRGIVVEVLRQAGEWVEPGDKVLRILRTDRLQADGLIPNDNVPADWRGLAATVCVGDASDEHKLPGKVVFVSPEVNPVNGLVRITVEFDNPQDALKPGLRARIVIPSAVSTTQPHTASGAAN